MRKMANFCSLFDGRSSMDEEEVEAPSYWKSGFIAFALSEAVITITALSLVGAGKWDHFNRTQKDLYQDHHGCLAQFSAVAFFGVIFFALCGLSLVGIDKVKRYLEGKVIIYGVSDLALTESSNSIQVGSLTVEESSSSLQLTTQRKGNRKSIINTYKTLDLGDRNAKERSGNNPGFSSGYHYYCFQMVNCCSLSPKLFSALFVGGVIGASLVGADLLGATWFDFVNSNAHLNLTKFLTVPIGLGEMAMGGRYLIYKANPHCRSCSAVEEHKDRLVSELA